MNETDIRKCIKHGYCWSSYGDHPTKRHIDADTMRNVLSGNKSRHATKREAQAAIAARKANSVKGTFMSQFSMAERKMLMPDCEFDEYGKTHTAAETEAELVRRSESNLKAAQAALDKAKTEADPLEWCERKKGEVVQDGDEVTYGDFDLQRERSKLDSFTGYVWFTPYRKAQEARGLVGEHHLRARYRNPLWLAKHGKLVESHETPNGDTQTKEVVTDEIQDKEPVKWSERTKGDIVLEGDDVSDANKKFDLQDTSSDIIFSVVHSWMEADGWIGKIVGEQTIYGHIIRARYITPEWKAWKERHDAKAKQEADGWTDEEIKRAAFQPREWTDIPQPLAPRNDPVNHPAHYTSSPSGIECIQVTEWMGFLLGNAVKYIWRAGSKGNEKQDLEKAVWYIRRRIEQIEKEEVK